MSKPTTKQQNAQKEQETQVMIEPFAQRRIQVCLLGTTPFVCHRQSEKTKRELLFPSRKRNKQAMERTLKHDPIQEYRDSPYLDGNTEGPTLILMKGGAFKSAACDSAVDTEDIKAAQVRRLVSVPDYYVSIYGKPKIWITDVRSAGINRTPDIRTRAILPEWCALVTFTYVVPHLNEKTLLYLIANGGITRGVGDGRTEKGALDFGQYTIVRPDDPTLTMVMKSGGRAVQEKALEDPECYDRETKDLLSWFQDERARRENNQTANMDESEEAEAEGVI